MIGTINRRIVECVKASKGMEITINPNDRNNRLTLTLGKNKRLAHDIGLAIQTYFNTQHNNE